MRRGQSEPGQLPTIVLIVLALLIVAFPMSLGALKSTPYTSGN
jgi:hypothetical protein